MADSADSDVGSLSLKELKALITEGGLSFADCIDKDDLRARAREAQEKLKAAPPKPAASVPSMPKGTKKLGGYDCLVTIPPDVESGASAADLVCVVLHGLGATNTDLAVIPAWLSDFESSLAAKKIVWIFPQAPSTVIGNAWWTLDVMGFMALLANKDPDKVAKLIREEPTGLAECRARFQKLVAEAKQLAGGVASSKVLFAGFSQGAITSLDIALQQPAGESFAGVVMMNGAPIVVEQWAERLKQHPKLRVHMSAGLQDMTLPCFASDWAHELLKTNGAESTLMKHPGGHDVGGPTVLKSVAKFISESLS